MESEVENESGFRFAFPCSSLEELEVLDLLLDFEQLSDPDEMFCEFETDPAEIDLELLFDSLSESVVVSLELLDRSELEI